MKEAKIIAHLQLIWNKRCYQYRIKISALYVTNEYVFDSYTWEKYWVTSFQAKKKVAVDTPYFTEKEITSLVVTPLPASTDTKGTGLAWWALPEVVFWFIHFHNVPSYWAHG